MQHVSHIVWTLSSQGAAYFDFIYLLLFFLAIKWNKRFTPKFEKASLTDWKNTLTSTNECFLCSGFYYVEIRDLFV